MQNNPKTKKIDVNNRTYLAPKVSEYILVWNTVFGITA